MKYYMIFALREYAPQDGPEADIVDTWSEMDCEGNPGGFEEKMQELRQDPQNLDIRVVEVDLDYEKIMKSFEPVVLTPEKPKMPLQRGMDPLER